MTRGTTTHKYRHRANKTKKRDQKKHSTSKATRTDQRRNWHWNDIVPIRPGPSPQRQTGPRALLITCGQTSASWEAIKSLLPPGRNFVDAMALKRDPHERKVRACLKTSVQNKTEPHTRIIPTNHPPESHPKPYPKKQMGAPAKTANDTPNHTPESHPQTTPPNHTPNRGLPGGTRGNDTLPGRSCRAAGI